MPAAIMCPLLINTTNNFPRPQGVNKGIDTHLSIKNAAQICHKRVRVKTTLN